RQHGVLAATAVTGFGLIGHLLEMVRASDVDVMLAIDRIPLLDGARETIEMGILSSLQPQNVRLRRAIRDLESAARHPLYPVLFDPQTAGGLLAAVPLARVHSCVDALVAAGYAQASAIGIISERSGSLEPLRLDLDGSIVAPILAGCRAGAPIEAASQRGRAHAESAV